MCCCGVGAAELLAARGATLLSMLAEREAPLFLDSAAEGHAAHVAADVSLCIARNTGRLVALTQSLIFFSKRAKGFETCGAARLHYQSVAPIKRHGSYSNPRRPVVHWTLAYKHFQTGNAQTCRRASDVKSNRIEWHPVSNGRSRCCLQSCCCKGHPHRHAPPARGRRSSCWQSSEQQKV